MGRYIPPEECKLRSEQAKARWARPGFRERVSESMKDAWAKPGARDRMSAAMRIGNANPAVKTRRSDARKKSWAENPNMRAGIANNPGLLTSERVSAMWADGTFDGKVEKWHEMWDGMGDEERAAWIQPIVDHWQHSPNTQNTSIEVAVGRVLDEMGVGYIQQAPLAYFRVDFYVPSLNLVIECDGDYWHGRPQAKVRDRVKNMILTKRGYSVVRLPESAIRQDAAWCVAAALTAGVAA